MSVWTLSPNFGGPCVCSFVQGDVSLAMAAEGLLKCAEPLLSTSNRNCNELQSQWRCFLVCKDSIYSSCGVHVLMSHCLNPRLLADLG